MNVPIPIVERVKPDPGGLSTTRRLFDRSDIVVVAAGPPACLRLLYFQALKRNGLNRLFLCPLQREDYALGSTDKVIGRCVQAAFCGARAVVLYLSCADLLSGFDYETAVREIGGAPIFVFRRGPLQKRKCKPIQRLTEIFAEIDRLPPAALPVKGPAPFLPPLVADYSGVCSELNGAPLLTALCTPGGCAGCVHAVDDLRSPDFALSRGDDLQAAFGWSELGTALTGFCRQEGKNGIVLVETPVMAMTGVDFQHQCERIGKEGLQAFAVDSNGFAPAPVGIAELYRAAGRRLSRMDAGGATVQVFGRALLREEDDLSWLVRSAARFGADLCLFKPDAGGRWPAGAALSLVAAPEALEAAIAVQQRWGTPLIMDLPIGRAGARRWRRQLARCFGQNFRPETAIGQKGIPSLSALILAEPLVALALGGCLEEDFGFGRIETALYAPDRSLRRLYETAFAGRSWRFFSAAGEVSALAQSVDWVIADPLYRSCLHMAPDCHFLPLPQRSLSGDTFAGERFPLFGEAGYKSLKALLLKDD